MKKKTIKNTIVACTMAGMITLGGTVSEATLGDRALYQGVTSPDVKELQQELKNKKFLSLGNTTTYFGSITKDAVMKFQRANGLSVDGSFGPASYRALKGTSSGSTTTSSSGQLTYSRALRSGTKGADVKALQLALQKLGHYKSSIDSSFGPGTKTAVMSFQRAQGLSADGSAGPSTINTINGVLSGKIAAGKPSAEPSRNDSGKSLGINIVNKAKQYIGGKYVFGGTTPAGFDCTGFTQYIYKQFGISIPRTTTAQATVGKSLSKSQLQPGDLIIFSNTYKEGPSHAAIYIGNGDFVHAANATKGIRVDSINSSYYSGKFHSGRKLF